jgi:hypothetical protein
MKGYLVLLVLACTALGLQSRAEAAEFSRATKITKVLSIAADRPSGPQSASLTRIYVDVAAWGTSNCRQDAVDLLPSDKHLMAMLLSSWASGRSLSIAVDDTRRSFDATCQVVWISAQ